ncbi:MAG TPA: NAD+ synthase, partial [Gemmatimonadaceae bacterium]|nr:NAD+ synthase [Gemmatimonadaceae bacterium]
MAPTLDLAIVQIRPRKGDYAANVTRIGEVLATIEALEPRPSLVQFAETAATGYFVEGAVRDLAVTAGTIAKDIAAAYRKASTSARPVDVVLGFYEKWRDTLHNSAAYIRLGDGDPEILHVHRKNFLPTYGLFDEERFVERGHELRAFDTPWGRAAILVCEDAWHSLSGTVAALDDAQLIFLSSAAPARGVWPRDDAIPGPASVARWERLVRDIAEEHGVFVTFSNLVGSEGGKMFPGSSMVMGPRGDLRVRAPVWDEAIVTAAIDLGDLTRARADAPLLADLRTALPHLRELLDAVDRNGVRHDVEWDPAVAGDAAATAIHFSSAASKAHTDKPQNGTGICIVRGGAASLGAPPPLDLDAALVEQWLVSFIRDEMRRRNFQRAVVGLSGGVDSAVTTYLAARALGPSNVVAVRLPYRTSSPTSLEHAQLVIDALGVESRTVDISAGVDGYLENEPDADPARRGNVMARLRMVALFDLSSRYHALPLGTGNKTERLFGYFTWHADDSPPINPLGDLFKSQVWALARHLGVPEVIVSKPASADLITGQTDEGDFGITYFKADQILNWLLSGYRPDELIARGFDAAEVGLVRRRLENTHWKRRLP